MWAFFMLKNKIPLPMAIRFFALTLFLALSCFYAFYKKGELDDYLKLSQSRDIVQKLPETLVFQDLELKKFLTPAEYFPQTHERLFLHFWATWCAPCEKEFPELEELILKLESTPNAPKTQYVFVALNDKTAELKNFLKRFKKLESRVLILRDENEHYKKFLGITKVPETWVFNRSKTVIKRLTGPQDWKQEYFVKLLSDNVGSVKIETH